MRPAPLLAQSRHHEAEFQCPLLGVKRTYRNVCYAPESGHPPYCDARFIRRHRREASPGAESACRRREAMLLATILAQRQRDR